MERLAADRRYGDLHEEKPYHDGQFKRWSKDASISTPYHYGDGVSIDVHDVDLKPDDDFLTPPSVPGETDQP